VTGTEDAPPDLMLDTEVAELLQLKRQTLANRRSLGHGPPYIKLGRGRIRYSRKAIMAWLEQNTVQN
jgi:predicted DNA-binding transcriptional regulator AlpA